MTIKNRSRIKNKTANRLGKSETIDLQYEPIFAQNNKPIVSAFRITKSNNAISIGGSQVVKPGKKITWRTSGPEGSRVTVTLERVTDSGGHSHSGGPVGKIVPSSFILRGRYPQNILTEFTAPDAAGSIKATYRHSTGEVFDVFNNVMVEGLIPLVANRGITLIGSRTEHPNNHFGTADLVQALQELGQAFYNRFKKNIGVNDMSLAQGGLFDWKKTWAPPHEKHREGRNADVRSKDMTADQKAFFEKTAKRLGFINVRLEDKDDVNEHWHVTI